MRTDQIYLPSVLFVAYVNVNGIEFESIPTTTTTTHI